ncbi:MAG TPA: DUF6220 domain-containing protein [Bacilli bacterium]
MVKEIESSIRVRVFRHIFHGTAWIMVACIVIQTAIAGMAVFADPAKWSWHTAFVHVFELVPLLMLIFAFVGKLSKALRWQSFGLFVLIYLQYFTAHVPTAGLLHPVIALLLFWLSFRVAKKAWQFNKGRESI